MPSVAGEVVESNHWSEADLLRPGIEVIPHAGPVAQVLPVSRRVLLGVKALRFLVEEEDVPVR